MRYRLIAKFTSSPFLLPLEDTNPRTLPRHSDDASTSEQHLPNNLDDHESKLDRADDVDQESCRRVVDHVENKADEDAENEDESEFDHLE